VVVCFGRDRDPAAKNPLVSDLFVVEDHSSKSFQTRETIISEGFMAILGITRAWNEAFSSKKEARGVITRDVGIGIHQV
jgi:hypothetical protein